MADEYTCKINGCDLRAEAIPEKDRWMFGNATHFSKMIAWIDRDLDRATKYICPECGAKWDRT